MSAVSQSFSLVLHIIATTNRSFRYESISFQCGLMLAVGSS